jgi:hypothetical protein
VDVAPGDTHRTRPTSTDNESHTNNEDTTKDLPILEDTVEDTVSKDEDQQYVVRAEPKVVEMKLQVDREKSESTVGENEMGSGNIPETAAVINESVKDAEDVKGGDLKSAHTEDSETSPAPEDTPSFIEWTQKQVAGAEKKKSEYSDVSFCLKGTSVYIVGLPYCFGGVQPRTYF